MLPSWCICLGASHDLQPVRFACGRKQLREITLEPHWKDTHALLFKTNMAVKPQGVSSCGHVTVQH